MSGTYAYNAANLRTAYALGDGTHWSYGYDSLGEVKSGNKFWATGTPVAGEQFGYSYDGIGNRTGTVVNGNAAGYTANSLNQYTQRNVPGIVEVTGSASTSAHVTVNDAPVNLYGNYFYATVPVDDSSAPVYEPVKVTAVKINADEAGQDEISQQEGYRYVPQTPEQYQYDMDGNLTQEQQAAGNTLGTAKTGSSACSPSAPCPWARKRYFSSPTTTWASACKSWCTPLEPAAAATN